MYHQSPSSPSYDEDAVDPTSGIRVVIQPSQSFYFAGEPFTCTVTFTNVHSPVPVTQSRPVSASFSPGHKRAAYSVSSAPLARPPTSPGTPRTAQPFLASQQKFVDLPERLHRRGLIGKPATAALERTRRISARSLSVDITPQDIIKRLADPRSPSSPVMPAYLSPYVNTSDLIQPSSPPQPKGNRPRNSQRPSFGLGIPLDNGSENSRVKSVGSEAHSPRTPKFATSFIQPSSELLLYAYAQLTGSLIIDSDSMPTSSELVKLRSALNERRTVGGGSLDIASGRRSRSVSNGSFFGFLSSPASSSYSMPHSPNLLSSFLGGSAPSHGASVTDRDDALPTLETQPSMLVVDLNLAPGESRSYSYVLQLPPHLPPTFKGRALHFSYHFTVGACRATSPRQGPRSHASPSQSPLLSTSFSQGQTGDRERQQSRIMRVPIRVYNHVAVGHGPIPYDLMWPIARRRGPAMSGSVEEMESDVRVAKQLKPGGSLASVQAYARRLLADEDELELEPTGEGGEGRALSGCAEAVEINTRNPKRISYDVSKDDEKVAALTFVKSAYRLGETILGVVELNESHRRSKVLKLSAMLEAHESLPWDDTPLRRVHAEHHASLLSDMQRVVFALDIPSDVSPAFKIVYDTGESTGGLEWKVRMCLLIAVATGGNNGSNKGKSRAVEVRNLARDGPAGDWGTSWRALESMAPMERLRARTSVPPARKSSGSWTSLLSSLARGTLQDSDSESEHGEDDDGGGWGEMRTETVECTVPLRVYAGNTAFRVIDVVYEV